MSTRVRVISVSIVSVLLMLLAPPARADAPNAPTIVGPAAGSTATAADVPLSVTATDPDGGSLDVRFVGRKLGATVPGGGTGTPFSLVALPDTQNYTYNNRQGTIVQQAQWVVNTRSQLSTAMVVQLGDLVSNFDNLTQWGHTSNGLKVLDDSGVPNTVVAGNHDFDNATGEFAQYDTFFPPSRYANKPWTPSSARYGGYLGQNLFGPDPVDRRNMNNFALFTAGGRDFLVLNLEWEAPRYALDWAAKVLAAYPDRIAILATHSFININGQRSSTAERPGGTPPSTMWTDFVSQQCSIRLVLNGHFHNGNLSEANRSDLNRCGRPVQQILTDYQDRANGGDGWLRYYTFDPAANTMTATTYSPKLNQFETDADSSFTLPFDLSAPQPAPFAAIGTQRVASGETARVTWTGLEPDTVYEWRAIADDGADTTSSPIWTVRTPPSPDLVDDTFTRNVTNGWGAADGSHAWQLNSSLTSYSVDGSMGRVTVPAGSGRGGIVTGVSGTDMRVTADVVATQAPSGSGTYVSLLARAKTSTSYGTTLRYVAGGSLTLSLERVVNGTETTLKTTNVAGLAATPGQPLRVRVETEGMSPTAVRAKVWSVGAAEPATWMVTATDSTAVLQSPGTAGLDLYTSSSATAPSILKFDRFTVSRLGVAPPPANQKPTAVIGTPTIEGRTVALSGTGSSDSDGTIAGYTWDFGDNTTGTGASPNHTYAADGTYTVSLTVTDDDGDTGTITRQVTVTAPPPAGVLARDSFGRTTSNGWGAAEVGGTWTSSGTTNRFAVAGGTGRHTLTAPGTSADSVLGSVSSIATDVRLGIAWSRTASAGTLYASVLPRRISSTSEYNCTVVANSDGTMQLLLVRRLNNAETTIGSSTLTGLTMTANQTYNVACQAIPSGTRTQLSGKVWRSGSSEPASWRVSATDGTAALQVAGGIGVNSYLSSRATAGVTLSVDDLLATKP
ncbi:MAG TPA: PKD domain-containing protein [Microlunatus sp.]|nr:PKD domain-containing protein [Microlunatus sp.]